MLLTILREFLPKINKMREYFAFVLCDEYSKRLKQLLIVVTLNRQKSTPKTQILIILKTKTRINIQIFIIKIYHI